MEGLSQEILEAEMSEHLQADRYERTGERRGYRSGHHSPNLVTRVGTLELRVPQERQGRFSMQVVERRGRGTVPSPRMCWTSWASHPTSPTPCATRGSGLRTPATASSIRNRRTRTPRRACRAGPSGRCTRW
ncbi:MAG: transposase [Armatimonadetes bacterium]|nr:transposase [Armatimonadota bacterium]